MRELGFKNYGIFEKELEYGNFYPEKKKYGNYFEDYGNFFKSLKDYTFLINDNNFFENH